MKTAHIEKFKDANEAACDRLQGLIAEGNQAVVVEVIENERQRHAYGILDSIRVLQRSGFTADHIVDSLIDKSERAFKEPRKLEQTPES